jgi:hypothetical protein
MSLVSLGGYLEETKAKKFRVPNHALALNLSKDRKPWMVGKPWEEDAYHAQGIWFSTSK